MVGNNNAVFPEQRIRHPSLDRSPTSSFIRPKTLEPASSSNARNTADFPPVVMQEDGFIKFETFMSHRKNLNGNSYNREDIGIEHPTDIGLVKRFF